MMDSTMLPSFFKTSLVSVAEKDDDFSDLRRVRGGHGYHAALLIRGFDLCLPVAFRNHFQNGVLVPACYCVGIFLGLSGIDQGGWHFHRYSELLIYFKSKHGAIGESEVGCLSVLTESGVLEEGVAVISGGLATFHIRYAVVVGNVPLPSAACFTEMSGDFPSDGVMVDNSP